MFVPHTDVELTMLQASKLPHRAKGLLLQSRLQLLQVRFGVQRALGEKNICGLLHRESCGDPTHMSRKEEHAHS